MRIVNKIAACIILLLVLLLPQHGVAKGLKVGDTVTASNGAKLYIVQERSAGTKIIVQALLFNMECNAGDIFKLGLGLEGDFLLPKFASVHAAYLKTYFNMQQMEANTLNSGQNALSSFSLFEVGGRLHLIDVKGRKKQKIVLGSYSNYNYGSSVVTEHYLRARLPCRRVFAARGGLYRTTTIANTDMNKQELAVQSYGAVKTADGTVFTNIYFTNAYTTGFYLGLSDLFNMWVYTKNNVSGYSGSTYRHCLFQETYVDVILAATTFDPFISAGKQYEIVPDAKESFQTSGIGWRVGKKIVFTRKTVNIGSSFELGNRPGVKGRGLFFGCGLTLAFAK